MLEIILITVGILVIVFGTILYLNSGYTDEVWSRKRYEVGTKNRLTNKESWDQGEIERIVIKRTHNSGKIEFIEREVKV